MTEEIKTETLKNAFVINDIINDIIKIADSLKTELWGIKNKEIDKFITIGLLENQIIYGYSDYWKNVTLRNKADIQELYDLLCNDKTFADKHEIAKITDEELEKYENEFLPIWR